MADDLVNNVLAIAMPKFFKGYTDAMAKLAVEFYWAQRHGLYTFDQGGREIQWRIRLQRGTPFGYSGGVEGRTNAVRNDHQIATLDWRGIADSVVITKKQKWECKGPEKIIDVIPSLLADMRSDLVDEFGTSFHSDGTRLSSLTFHGLNASINSSAQTYASLSQTTYTNWDCQRISGTGFSADPLNMIHQLILACAVGVKGGRSRNMLSLLITDQTEYRTIVQAEESKVRYTRDLEMAKAGFENVELYGVPCVWSEYAPATTVRGLNHNLFEIVCATSELFETGVDTTPGFPKLDIGWGVSHFNLLNKNPRGSGIIHTIT